MKTALNKLGQFPADDGGMFDRLAEAALLDSAEGVATRARVDAATCEFYAERAQHVRQVTLVILRARGVK